MQPHTLKPNTPRKKQKRIGRGGKRGTTSGGGTKGQKGRAGAGVKPGFRGGDNRLWQLFPKQRGASKKPGSNKPHRKHRFFALSRSKPAAVNLDIFNQFTDGVVVTPVMLAEKGIVGKANVKVLGDGELTKKITFDGFTFSASAREKIKKAGGVIAAAAK